MELSRQIMLADCSNQNRKIQSAGQPKWLRAAITSSLSNCKKDLEQILSWKSVLPSLNGCRKRLFTQSIPDTDENR